MVNDDVLIKNLNKLFTNKKFMLSIIEQENGNIEAVLYKMGLVLQYYIITRDENIDYSYQDIEEKYFQSYSDNEKENIIENGFMTHSFNGYKKDLIEKNGLNYEQHLTIEQKQQINERRKILNQLEDILGVSQFITLQKERKTDYSNSVFVCSPGAKTFHYACKRSPERLYEGPLKGYENEPIIVGETKSSYLYRILEKRIIQKAKNENWREEQYKSAVELVRKVAEIYGGSHPAFAMLKIKDIKDIKFSQVDYDEASAEALGERLERAYYFGGERSIFSQNSSDMLETNNLGDLVTLAEYIPKNSIFTVECMDEFEMQQIYARSKGLHIGDYIDYSEDKKLGNPTISELLSIIDNCKDINLLNQLEEKFELVKSDIKDKIDEISRKNDSEYKNISEEEITKKLLIQKQKLQNEEETILNKSYEKKEGIDTSYTLKDAINILKENRLMQELLQSDEKIKNDQLQYVSELHGVSHTRRVNFLATLIMNFENVDSKTANLIRTFVQNHDIGRTNDEEDKEHGNNSVEVLKTKPERLEMLTEEEKEKVNFVIKEHSLSATQNEEDLNMVFEEKIQKYRVEKVRKIPAWGKKDISVNDIKVPSFINKEKEEWKKLLDICKDADKLDRVRLDLKGTNIKEGLDISRLSLNNSKGLENVAYEGYSKILDILDIEEKIQSIEQKLDEINILTELKQDYKQSEEFEQKLYQAKDNCNKIKERFLKSIVNGKRFSKIAEIPKKIKEIFLPKENTKGEL